jgi:hypothetical protein
MTPSKLVQFITLIAAVATAANGAEVSPREAYNQGTQALKKGYLRESENWLLKATGSQRESIQPPALYNLGHVRFKQGQELLKGESQRQDLHDRAETAAEDGADAISNADRALKGNDIMAILEAYMNGRATRKQLRLANEDVQRALELYGSVLVRWRRSVGDFRSSDELQSNADARDNAKTVQRYIEELLRHKDELEQQKQALSGERSDLKQKLQELKGKIPKEMMQPGQGDDDNEDDEDEGDQPKPESGFQDRGSEAREKRGITPEMAQQILEALGINGDRKLPLGGDEDQSKPRDRRGKDW